MSKTNDRLTWLEEMVKSQRSMLEALMENQRDWTKAVSEKLGMKYQPTTRYTVGYPFSTSNAEQWLDIGESGFQVRIRLSDRPGVFWIREKPKDG